MPLSLPEMIATVLAPHLGDHSADVVARHVCSKYGILEGSEIPDAAVLAQLREFLRRGLVAYVGPEKAEALAAECTKGA
jgi:hypothetical protein